MTDPSTSQADGKAPRQWQDAPNLSDEERRVAEALKAAAEAMLAIPEDQKMPFANPDKFHGPIGFLENGLPSGGVAAHAPQPHRSWTFNAAEKALLLQAIGAAPPDDDAAAALPAQDTAAARRDLARRGLLTERGPDPELAAALLTTAQPDATIAAAITRSDQPARQVTVHQRQDQATIHWTGADGHQRLDLYPAQQAGAGLWRYVAFDLNELLPSRPGPPARSARRAASAAIYRVTLTGENLRTGRVATFGWFIGDDILWMVRPAPADKEPSPEPQAEPADYPALEAALVGFCQQVIEGDEA